MFDYYNTFRENNPDALVGDGYEYAANKMVEEQGVTREVADFLEGQIQYMGEGFVDSIEKFKSYRASSSFAFRIDSMLNRTSEKDGKRLSNFGKGDIVYRNYNGRYEEYTIEDTSKSVWKLVSPDGTTSDWNAENNDGFLPKDFAPEVDEEVEEEAVSEVTPEEAVTEEIPAEEGPSVNKEVNALITKKNRYNKIPKKRKPLAGKLLNEIKTKAERLGFTVVNVKDGNISVVSKENGKVVARRGVDRGFYKEQNEKVRQAKSMAGDFAFGIRGSILLYFLNGGKVSTSSAELGEGSKELEAAKRAGLVSDTATGADSIAKEDLPELGAFVSDEQEAITEIQNVLASFENKEQMEDELVEMFEKEQRNQDEAAKYEYEYQMRAAIRNDELVGLDEDELVEYYESLSEDEKVKTIEDYEKFYQEVEREQPEQGGQGGTSVSTSEGAIQEEGGAESTKSKRLQKADELRKNAQDLRDASGGTLMAGPKLLAAAYDAYASILEATENIIEAINKFRKTKEYKALDAEGKAEIDSVLSDDERSATGAPRTPSEVRQAMEDSSDAIDRAIASGVDPQTAVNNLIGSRGWYKELAPSLKDRFDNILQDEFGASPKAVAKPKAPTGVAASISSIVDNYYKIKDGDRAEKSAARDAINQILDSDPKLKYIYDNIRDINKQLQAAGVITSKTDGCP
jgi:hypothetical protein